MAVDVIVGLQRGDEGKGRFVDLVAGEYQVIARGNGGANAGHTIIPEGLEPIALHQIPSGIAYRGKLNIIGNGAYLDPVRLVNELDEIKTAGLAVSPKNLLISDMAHLVFPHHIALDAQREGSAGAQGSTKSGIAYVAADKYLREGMRAESIADSRLLFERALDALCNVQDSKGRALADCKKQAAEWASATAGLKPYLGDSVQIVNDRLEAGDEILAEGAQAFWLDVNHGMYPAVTSSSTTVNGLLDGLGVSAKHLGKVIGVAKVMKSHVGGGPFVTEILDDKLADNIRGPMGKTDSEYGATTKRPRRVGYPDLVELRNAIRVNGVDEIVLSKMDLVSRYGRTMKVAVAYEYDGAVIRTAPSSAIRLETCRPVYEELPTWGDISKVRKRTDLPAAALDFVALVEDTLGVKVSKLGVGPERSQVVLL